MKNHAPIKLWIFLVVGCLVFSSVAQANTLPEVTNVAASQRPLTYLVDISYDLFDADSDPMIVTAYLSIDGGATFPFECTTVSGDVGVGVLSATGLQITWDAETDYPDYNGTECSIRVVADDGVPPASILNASITFQSSRDGDSEIFTWDGTDLTQLTNNTVTDEGPDWFDDRIVYHSTQDGSYDIWIMDQDGGSPVNLTNSASIYEMGPKWSPDGSRIAFIHWTVSGIDIYVMNADGSGLMQLTDDPASDGAPAWSPDGTQIAFQSSRSGNREIYVMNSDGSGEPTRLTFDEDFSDSGPEWSPDGSQIVFSKYITAVEGAIWIMEADGSSPHAITGTAGTLDTSPSWSPDGNQILFVRYANLTSSTGDIWLTTPSGDAPVPVVTFAANDGGPGWQWFDPSTIYVTLNRITESPGMFEVLPRLGVDATSEIVAFTAFPIQPDKSYGLGVVQAQRLNPDGAAVGAVIQVSDGLTSDKYPDVSGSLISYSVFESSETQLGWIKVYDLEAGEVTWVLPEPETVYISSIKGNAVVWDQGQSGALKIKYYDLAWSSNNPVTIAGPSPPASDPAIDSRYVVFESQVNYQGDISAYDLWSGLQIQVATDPDLDERMPATSGSRVVWQSTNLLGNNTIEMADLSQTPIVYTTLVDDGGQLGRPSIDGDYVVYESNAGGELDIYLVRISDGRIFTIDDRAGNQYHADVLGDKITYVDLVGDFTDVWVATFSFPGGM